MENAAPVEKSSLLILGGWVVTVDQTRIADIRIREGKIVEMGEGLRTEKEEQVINAKGLQILPGGIDLHAHLMKPFADDYLSGSQAALAGGITTIGCMTYLSPSIWKEGCAMDTLAGEEAQARKETMADLLFHPVVYNTIQNARAEFVKLREHGYKTIKIFMVMPSFAQNPEAYAHLIHEAGQVGLLTLVHCEDYHSLEEAAEELTAQGQTSLQYYAESRPISSEVRAVEQAIRICEKTRSPMYLVHISSQAALDLCQKAKKRGLPVFVETRPIYLYFTQERYQTPDGPLYVGQPPLREKADTEALWEGLAQGLVDTLGSDHAPWTRAEKMDSSRNIHDLRPGVADLQTMLPVFYSEGVIKKRLSLERFVALTSTNAAKLCGLFPQKGTLAVGSDADIVVWDPQETRKLQKEELLSKAGFSLHEGWEIQGWPKITIHRGKIVYENHQILGTPGSGSLLMQATRKK